MEQKNTESQATESMQLEPSGSSAGGTQSRAFDELLKANKAYQSEFDRRVSKAIDTAKVNWTGDKGVPTLGQSAAGNDEYEAARKELENEINRFSTQEELEIARAELEKEKAKFLAMENKVFAEGLFKKHGIPLEASSLLMGKTTEETEKKIFDFIGILEKWWPTSDMKTRFEDARDLRISAFTAAGYADNSSEAQMKQVDKKLRGAFGLKKE